MSKITPNETITQDEFLESKIKEMLDAKLASLEANEVTLGVQLQKMDKSDGKQKTHKDGSPIFNEDGEVQYWADSYYATLSFNGGEVKQKVTLDQKITLESGSRFVAKGRLKLITPEVGQSYLKPDFTDFHKIF